MTNRPSPKAEPQKTDVVLILPPQWAPLNPYYALALLAGELHDAGYQCSLRDLNMEFYHRMLSPEHLSWCRIGAEQRLNQFSIGFIEQLADMGPSACKNATGYYNELVGKIEKCELYWDTVVSQVQKAKDTLRDPDAFYDPHQLAWAFDVLSKALEIASLPYYPSRLLLRDYQNKNHKMNLADLMAAVDAEDENMFKPFYDMVLPSLQEEEPKIIGISINATSQVVGGLTLAAMIKATMPNTMVAIGGNFFTRVTDTLQNNPEFFQRFCDVLIYGEGERPLLALLNVLEGSQNLENVPNVLYLNPQGYVVKTAEGCPKPLDTLALPRLEGLDLHGYFTPEIVVPIQASRGCYWKKCSFCDHDFGANFNLKSVPKLIEEMAHLVNTYGIRQFEFVDEAISPRYLREMSQAILEAGLDVRFFMYARTERGFTPQVMELAYRAGCRMVLWGVESGSKRVMKLINKGVPFEGRFQPLEHANQAGIWNFCFIFFGFPTETIEEALSTIEMVMDHKDVVHSFGQSHFTLGKHTQIRENPEYYGIANIQEDEEELSTKLNYEITLGMTPEELIKVSTLCTEVCNDVYRAPLWFSIGFREFLHLYLDRYGIDYVKNFSYQESQTEPWMPTRAT